MPTTTKIRSTIAVLAAALIVALAIGGSVSPAAHASKNDKRYEKSSEAQRKKLQRDFCNNLQGTFRNLGTAWDSQWAAGETANADKTMESMKAVLSNAKKAGCGWAVRVMPPQPPAGNSTPTTTAPTAAG